MREQKRHGRLLCTWGSVARAVSRTELRRRRPRERANEFARLERTLPPARAKVPTSPRGIPPYGCHRSTPTGAGEGPRFARTRPGQRRSIRPMHPPLTGPRGKQGVLKRSCHGSHAYRVDQRCNAGSARHDGWCAFKWRWGSRALRRRARRIDQPTRRLLLSRSDWQRPIVAGHGGGG